jgi:tape measure domain-containing protein
MNNTIGGSVIWNLDLNDKSFQSGLNKARQDVGALADQVDGKINGLTNSIIGAFKRAEGASFAFATGLGAALTAAVGAVGFGVKMAADIETATQGFTTLLGSAEKANEAIEMIKKDAATTPFNFAGLVRSNQMLTSVTKNAQRSEGMLLNVGKALSAAGKGTEELDNVIVNLQQIANTGKISELDIRQFGFAGINILELLADYYGTTKDAAGDMVKNSKDAFADLEGAFKQAGEGGGRFSRAFIDQAGTFNQLWSAMGDTVSQTAAEIVQKTGIFDAVKNSIAGITSALVAFQPQIVSGIKSFIDLVVNNGPIIIGIIAGGLAPAFVAVASAIGGAVLALAPFLIVGALVGLAVQAIVEYLGGWEAAQKRVNEVITLLVDIFNTQLKPRLTELWTIISTQLIPQLQRLWEVISPVLIPVLKLLAAFLAGALIVAFILVIETLKVVITWISEKLKAWMDLLAFLKSIPGAISSAFSTVYNALTQPFENAYNKIKDIAGKIKNELQNINPFHRNSPSLVDNVIAGVKEIKDQYESLKDMHIPKSTSVTQDYFKSPTLEAGNYSTPSSTSPVSKGQEVIVNMRDVRIGSEQDAESVARKIGFRVQTSPLFLGNG